MSVPHDIREAQAALSDGSTTVLQLTRDALVTARANADLNIFLEIFDESALAKAREVDAKLAQGAAGPLAGAIVSIKDNICYKDHMVSASSRMLEGYTSIYSATVVDRLLAADAVIIGRTNCDEFAMGSSNENSAFGPVGNPIDPSKVPGGSSGGAAASVAAGICQIALGSDTGGSIRQPASFCGVVGFKPTYGRVSRYGLIAFASSLDQIGPLANNVDDVEAVHRVIAGRDPLDDTSSSLPLAAAQRPTEPLRIAYYRDCMEHEGLDPEIKECVEAELERLSAAGHHIEAIELPLMDRFVPTYYILSTAEASSNLARFDGIRYGHRSTTAKGVEETYRKSRSEGFGAEVQRRILLGTFVLSSGYYDAYYAQGMRVRRMIRDNTLRALDLFDVVLTPTCPTTAFPHGHINDPVAMYLQDIFTVQANLAGLPAISLPVGTHSNGMPFGIQLMSKPFADERLLAIARDLFPR
ncbi:MAG: Asp-tRNA(Asn)/Glu-tRNA(Gln) amidotransferase subunit GatA [Flavobacteriales bacterium]